MFCNHCGAPLQPGQVCACQAPCAINPVVAAIKTMGRSPLFLLICIAQSVATFFAFLSSAGELFTLLENWQNYDANRATDLLADGSVFSTSYLLPALLTLAFWLIFATCRQNTKPTLSTGGLTLCKVVLILLQVIAFAAGGIVLLAAIVVPFMGEAFFRQLRPLLSQLLRESGAFPSTIFDSNTLVVLCLVILVLALVGIVFFIIALFAAQKSLGVIKENFAGILTDRSLSKAGLIMGFILAVSRSISVGQEILQILSSLASAAALFMLCLLGMTYRNEMQQLREQSRACAVAAPQPPQPVDRLPELPEEPADQQPLFAPAPAPQPPCCQNCGEPLQPHHIYCPYCGQPQTK